MDTGQRKRRIARIAATNMIVLSVVATMVLAYIAVTYPARTELGTLFVAVVVMGVPTAIVIAAILLLNYSTKRPLPVYTGKVVGHEIIDAYDTAAPSSHPRRYITASGELMTLRRAIHIPKNWRVQVESTIPAKSFGATIPTCRTCMSGSRWEAATTAGRPGARRSGFRSTTRPARSERHGRGVLARCVIFSPTSTPRRSTPWIMPTARWTYPSGSDRGENRTDTSTSIFSRRYVRQRLLCHVC